MGSSAMDMPCAIDLAVREPPSENRIRMKKRVPKLFVFWAKSKIRDCSRGSKGP